MPESQEPSRDLTSTSSLHLQCHKPWQGKAPPPKKKKKRHSNGALATYLQLLFASRKESWTNKKAQQVRACHEAWQHEFHDPPTSCSLCSIYTYTTGVHIYAHSQINKSNTHTCIRAHTYLPFEQMKDISLKHRGLWDLSCPEFTAPLKD